MAKIYFELERRAEDKILASKFIEEVAKRVSTAGLMRLTPEEAQRAVEKRMPELKKAEWKDYVGIRDNFELMKMSELV
jgi:hypothetical protein